MILDSLRRLLRQPTRPTDRTELCKLALHYKTDKVRDIRHNYTPIYHELFHGIRQSAEVVVEIGIGHQGNDVKNPSVSHMSHVQNYMIGASLYMWRDYFPNAQIIGIDISPECIFSAERISTALVDQSRPDELSSFITSHVRKPIDVVIDDGSHVPADQVAALVALAPHIRKGGGIYVIEDVAPTLYNNWSAFFTSEVRRQLRAIGCSVERKDLRKGNPGVADEYLIIVRR